MRRTWRVGLILALGGLACGGQSPDTPPEDPNPPDDPPPVGTKGGAVVGGIHHTCGMNATGLTWCWGRNSYEELGDGTGNFSPIPVKAKLEGVVELSVGNQFTCARTKDSATWCWGRIISETPPPEPVKVNDLGTDVVQLASHESRAVALKRDGSLWSIRGGLQVALLYGGVDAKQVSQGDALCFIKTDGSLWCVGNNDQGTVGNGSTTPVSSPVAVSLPGKAKQVSAGPSHTCAVVEDGSVWCWGGNERGETGQNPVTSARCPGTLKETWPCTPSPAKVEGLPARALAVQTGYAFTVAHLEDGSAWAWGVNDYNQLGTQEGTISCEWELGPDPCRPTPRKVPIEQVESLSSGDDHSCVCKTDGTAWCWGDSSDGILGIDRPAVPERGQPPVQVKSFRCH